MVYTFHRNKFPGRLLFELKENPNLSETHVTITTSYEQPEGQYRVTDQGEVIWVEGDIEDPPASRPSIGGSNPGEGWWKKYY